MMDFKVRNGLVRALGNILYNVVPGRYYLFKVNKSGTQTNVKIESIWLL